jgi:hypothetical protein
MRNASHARTFVVATAALAWSAVSANAAPITVAFNSTILESPFATGDLATDRALTGVYTYESSATPSESGTNFARYDAVVNASLTAGPNTWVGSVTDLIVAHSAGIELPDDVVYAPADFYLLNVFSPLSGPSVGGTSLAFFLVALVDTEATAYTSGTPLTFPNPNLFEVKQVHLNFLDGSRVHARIDSIGVVPEPSSITLLGLGILGQCARLIKRRRQ